MKVKDFNVTVASSANALKLIKCKLCDKVFERQVQLGGHASKAHPGQSKAYERKKTIYKERTHERETRVKASDWFTAKTGLCVKKYRAVITKVKKDMLAGKTPTLPKHILAKIEKSRAA